MRKCPLLLFEAIANALKRNIASLQGQMRQAVILVGGRGTRLGELAASAPKPLIPITGAMSLLDYLLANLARHGIQEIVLLAGHMGDLVRQAYDGKSLRGARMRVVIEPSPAGTAGALRHAADHLDSTFFMLNGDSYFDFNYLALSSALKNSDVGAIALKRVSDTARFGTVEVRDDRATAFREKDQRIELGLVSTGTYVLRRDILDFIRSEPCSLENDVFPVLARDGLLAAVEGAGDFIDIGLPATLEEARRTFADRTRRGAVFFDRDGTLTVDAGYTHNPEQLQWEPGAIQAIRAVNDAGWLAIVVTNQAGVARGLYGEDDVRRFHEAMQRELGNHGAHIDAFYYCPYHGDGTIPAYAHADHPDRKPNPGMLRRAIAEWPIDPRRSFLVGDHESDVAAASAIGIEGGVVAAGALADTIERCLGSRAPRTSPSDLESALKQRAAIARTWLFDQALPLWWQSGFDAAHQCFHEKLALDGTPYVAPRRTFVQARQLVVYAQAGRLGWPGPWRDAVRAGVNVLLQRGLTHEFATRHALDSNGSPMDDRKDLYDAAFFILAFAEAASSLGESALLSHADGILAGLDKNWALPQGGFQEGEINSSPPRRQNPHMHMFEACLALHEASGDRRHLAKATDLATLFAERLFDPAFGALPEYRDDVWRSLAGEEGRAVEPGHHFEWSWLLLRWNRLGGGDLDELAEQLRVHAEVYGVDLGSQIVYDEISIEGMPRRKSSRLWPHTERLKANLARFEQSRDRQAGEAALAAFDTLFRFLDTPTKGLWRDHMTEDNAFIDEPSPASSFYHIMGAFSELMRVSKASP